MNADQILEHFHLLGDAPDTVLRLRKLVVVLAIAGKLTLVEQENSSAPTILDQIEAEKKRLIRTGMSGLQKSLPPIELEELPTGFSNVAAFARLGTIARIEKGPTGIQGALPGPYPLVVTAENRASCDHFDFEGSAAIIPLVSSTGHGKASLHRLHYQEGRFALGSILAAIFPFVPTLVSARFLYEYLSAFKEELLVSRMMGTANVALSIGKIAEVPVPIVSAAVQRRVDELMGLCDQLEQARADREARRDRLAAATLARLSQPTDDLHAFRKHASFALEQLAAITTRPEQVKALRQTILNLAVRGNLVPQDPSDEPASELLKRIERKRELLLESGYPNPDEARAQTKKLSEQVVPDRLDALPNGWSWATLMQCSVLVVDCKNKTAPYTSNGIKLVRTTNVRDGRLNAIDQKYVDQKTYEIWSARCKPEPGDILITREAPMGEVCLIPEGEQICLGQRMMLARIFPEMIDRDFVLYSLRDPKLMDRVQDKPIGAIVQHLRVGGVETLLVPLPPLAEQRRIVARVDELMGLCNRLEASLVAGDGARRRLLDSVLSGSLEPEAAAV